MFRYLIRSEFVQAPCAENDLTSLCLNYLAFDCFEDDISEEQRRDFVLQGYLAFADYAAVHWSDHLRTTIKAGPAVLDSQIKPDTDLQSALVDFVEHYQLGTCQDAKTQVRDIHCLQFEHLPYFDELCLVFRLTQRQQAKGRQGLDEIIPQLLERTILSSRATLEKLAVAVSFDADVKETLKRYYGLNWYKCTKAACYYFHEGFQNETLRDYHVLRHEQPFRCEHTDCESGYKLGFTSLKQLEKHRSNHHPEDTKIMATFARLKNEHERRIESTKQTSGGRKESARFSCHLCSKAYTRSEKLRKHLETHSDDRTLVECTVDGCGKFFSNEDVRKRHEKEVHFGEKQFICSIPLKSGIAGSEVAGCKRAFPRPSALENHWRSKAGQACLRPLRDEEELERQWHDQMAKRKVEGSDPPLPRQVYDRFPELRKSMSAAVEAEDRRMLRQLDGKSQFLQRSPMPEVSLSQATAKPLYKAPTPDADAAPDAITRTNI